jgi:hypothetical protein
MILIAEFAVTIRSELALTEGACYPRELATVRRTMRSKSHSRSGAARKMRDSGIARSTLPFDGDPLQPGSGLAPCCGGHPVLERLPNKKMQTAGRVLETAEERRLTMPKNPAILALGRLPFPVGRAGFKTPVNPAESSSFWQTDGLVPSRYQWLSPNLANSSFLFGAGALAALPSHLGKEHAEPEPTRVGASSGSRLCTKTRTDWSVRGAP